MRKLLEKVRVDGYVQTRMNGAPESIMPFIYREDCDPGSEDALHYWNSGGRSILFEKEGKVYKLKGVDPSANLTTKIAKSEKNRMQDVIYAYDMVMGLTLEHQPEGYYDYEYGKPFGVLTKKGAEKEEVCSKIMRKIYESFGIKNPCEFRGMEKTGIERKGMTYQVLFEIPSHESDFRGWEYIEMLNKELREYSKAAHEKLPFIKHVFEGFISWAGFGSGLLAKEGLLPSPSNTFRCMRPHNWVISRTGNGYGIFYVDHSSTERIDPKEAKEQLSEWDEVPMMAVDNSDFLQKAFLAANREMIHEDSRNYPFNWIQILSVLPKHRHHIEEMKEKHTELFFSGMEMAGLGTLPKPISEGMLYKALE